MNCLIQLASLQSYPRFNQESAYYESLSLFFFWISAYYDSDDDETPFTAIEEFSLNILLIRYSIPILKMIKKM